jgi:diacylglycerol kinase (ATP)
MFFPSSLTQLLGRSGSTSSSSSGSSTSTTTNTSDQSTSSSAEDKEELLVFVNKKSGGHQGATLIAKFREFLPTERVIDIIEEGGPLKALQKFKDVPNLKILACGGDGTGKWVLETLDKMEDWTTQPPVAVLPLGTGNDIARVLGWGGGYAGEDLRSIVSEVKRGAITELDRWKIEITTVDPTTGDPIETKTHCMNNYLSLGFADARIALDFHRQREENPSLFATRGINKLWYCGIGAKVMLKGMFQPVASMDNILDLTVDGVPVPVPGDVEGLVVLNLPSYAGGMNLWGTLKEERFDVVSMSDGRLEIIGIRSVFHLSQIGTGIASGVRIAQGSDLVLSYRPNSPPLPGKIDGEPWLQEQPANFHISWLKQSPMICRSQSVSSVTKPTKTGWLQKKGANMLSAWRTRWFILKESHLYYYATTQDTKPRGVIDLKFACVSEDNSIKNCFVIFTTTRNWYLVADSEDGTFGNF